MCPAPGLTISMNRFQKLSLATAVATIVLFAVGGLVRGTGSGLGCSTWPACEPGQLFPSGTVHSLIEFSHRALVFVATVLIAASALVAVRSYRRIRSLAWPAVAGIPLVIGQAILGGVVVHTDLNPWWVTVHFALALALVADVTFVAANSFCAVRLPDKGASANGGDRAFARLTLTTTVAAGALLLIGTYVRARGAGLAFTDWPLMDGRLVPALGGVATPMFAHRMLAAAVFLLVGWMAIRARIMASRSRDLVVLSSLALGLFVAQILSGAANVWTRLRPWAVVLHVALSVLIWATMVALATVSRRLARHARIVASDGEPGGAPSGGTLRETVSAFVRLTKPRIIVLLLITTVPAMILAAGGMPSLVLVLSTLVGGAAAAGSANAINMYLDRDIDEVMRRTRQRPIPAHVVTPDQALRFGFVMGAASFAFLAIAVNVLAATLALSAIAFYVFVYTMWLKRTTAQNIVIGGAAGAAPALVGWAAVTGSLAAPAWVLFAIVFLWTPPHFWALSIRFRGDYAAAGVPMLPVLRGEDETRRQIFLYSIALFGTTLLLYPIGGMGPIYLATALALGGAFVFRALRLWLRPADRRTWALFRYSIVYLAALFAAVALDGLVTRGR
jgi:heme o synthase